MGLIRAAGGAVGGVLADQWKEYFYCESLPDSVLVSKGEKRVSGRSSNVRGEDNIITTGSGIAVADGQSMIIVEQGKVIDFSAEPGMFIFDSGGEPTLFYGDKFSENVKASLSSAWERFKYGGIPGKDTRIYFFNMKELPGQKYGTPNPVPFRVVDHNIGLDIDIAIRCFGEYSFHLNNPILFYTNVSGNVPNEYTVETIESQLKTELLTALQPAFARISEMGIRYSALPAHTDKLADILNEVLSEKWRDLRGIEIVSFGVSSVTASPEDENLIKELQKSAVMRDPTMAAAALTSAQADAMRAAASNDGSSVMGFMGMGLAGQAGGMNAQNLFAMGQQQQAQGQAPAGQVPGGQAPGGQAPVQGVVGGVVAGGAGAAEGWKCPNCGHEGNTGKFCSECGTPKPAPASWTCPNCGHQGNTGKFCSECGTPQP